MAHTNPYCLQIFLLGHDGQGRGTAATECWKEDVQWARRLDQGWDLTKVKQVGFLALDFL